jgi:AraC-like DNA-binding protein
LTGVLSPFFINDKFIRRFLSENPTFIKKQDPQKTHNLIYGIDANDSLRTLIESVFHYLKKGDKTPVNLVEIKFKKLLFNLVLNPKNKLLLDFFNAIPNSNKATIEHVMLENFQYNLKIDDFAKLCGKSLSSFKRDFKEYFNSTPGKWIIEKRLDHSKSLLLGTDLRISEIGYACGFKNNSHFIQAFKEKYKLPPNQFILNTISS